MTNVRSVSRLALLVGVSSAAMMLAGFPATAQDMFKKAPRSPAARSAEVAAQRATQDRAADTATKRTIEAFNRAAQARQRMDEAQAAARAAAKAAQANVPNGLGQGGLQVAAGATPGNDLWIGANGPSQTSANGRTRVEIDQTQEKAILTWDSFNVGRETDLVFDQQGNTSWAVLNRVTDVSADPSRILGTIKADGTVLIANRNGIIFGGASQVNARNIVAAAADVFNEQFRERGIYSELSSDSYNAAFFNAGGSVTVEAGAQLATSAPNTVLEGGGYVLLLGKSIDNAGSIRTPRGQALLAAGDDFLIRPGFGTETNQASTTRGNEVKALIGADSDSGAVLNRGLIEASRGDITLTGRNVTQDGVLLSTTSVDQRGTIHLLTSANDPESAVTITANGLNAILPELDSDETASNAQRDALLTNSAEWDRLRINQSAQFDNLALLSDRADQSRVEIVSGGNVHFASGSTVLAQGGQIAVSAKGRIQTEAGAILDVSGVRGIALDIGSNAIQVRIQPNEMRDNPVNRDTGLLNGQEVWVDARDLVFVPAGTGGSTVDRYYTSGGLLELGGYLGNTPHTIGEWVSVGGTITLSANEVVAKNGSIFNIAGGSIDYAGGSILSSRLQGEDGRLYNINDAPAGMKFVSVGRSQVVDHGRWGQQYREVYSNAMFNRGVYVRNEDPYSVGRDGGTLALSAPTVLFDGEIVSEAVQGARQIVARPDGSVDGYKLGQNQVALNGGLTLGQQSLPSFLSTFDTDVRFTELLQSTADSFSLADAVAGDRVGTAWFDAEALSQARLGRIDIATTGSILVDRSISLTDGGELGLAAPTIDIRADITARSGNVSISDIHLGGPLVGPNDLSVLTLSDGATIDTRGVWVNAFLEPGNLAGLAHLDGGNVTIRSTQDVVLETGSVIDASSGAAILEDGAIRGGRGGDITLIAGDREYNGALYASSERGLVLDGSLASYGVTRGGRLTISTPDSVIIGSFDGASGVLSSGTAAEAGFILSEDMMFEAGESLPLPSVLAEATVLPAGSVLPAPVSYTVNSIPAGQPLASSYSIPQAGLGIITLAEDWTVPSGTSGIYGYMCGPGCHDVLMPPGTIMKKGWQLYPGYGTLPAGYVLPSDVFPNGLPIPPTPVNLPAGTVLEAPVTLPAGTTLPANIAVPGAVRITAGTYLPQGSTLPKDAAIRPVLNLAADMFSGGFSDYVIESDVSLTVAKGTTLDVAMPALRVTAAGFAVPTGVEPSTALELWAPPEYLEDPVHGQLMQRGGASLTLKTSPALIAAKQLLDSGQADGRSLGAITIGEASSIRVDDGQAIRVSGWGQVTVEGELTAHGGSVSVINERPKSLEANADPHGLSVWIGDHALLDVSGRAVTALDRQGRQYGSILDGGNIILGREIAGRDDRNELISTDAFVIVRSGAVLEASGATASIDLNAGLNPGLPSRSTQVSSNGGQISLSSTSGLYMDGTLHAAAGGQGAAGGTLSLALESPVYNPNDAFRTKVELPDSVKAARIITISQQRAGELPVDLVPGGAGGVTIGEAHIGVDQIEAGGFGNVSMFARDLFQFDGDVTLSTAQSLAFHEGGFGLTVGHPEAKVSLSAPYVLLDGFSVSGADSARGDTIFWSQNTPSDLPLGGSLHVTADHIDVGERVSFYGARASTWSGVAEGLPFDAPGFADVTLTSTGDLRLLKARELFTWSGLYSAGDLSLIAGQIYPATDATAMIVAGYPQVGAQLDPDAALRIGRSSDLTPAAPLSAFGRLALVAPTVEQGGIVRAPFGALEVGLTGQTLFGNMVSQPLSLEGGSGTRRVTLLPGSITSVSGAGLVVPYGGTSDGLTYYHDGLEVIFPDPSGVFSDSFGFVQGLSLGGEAIDVQDGAVIDLSGGGTIAGKSFVAGRGGSVDVLEADFVERGLYGQAGGEIYAIVPGYQSGYAPSASENGAGDPTIGRQVTIAEGVPGLPAGVYTLLPSNYALLPGGFRVEIGGALNPETSTATLPDGSYMVGARLGIANTNIVDAIPSQVLLTSGEAVRRRSGYSETSYNQFAALQASTFGTARAFTPEDARSLMLRFGTHLSEERALTMAGEVKLAPAEGGRGGALMVAAQRYDNTVPIEVLGPESVATSGYLSLYAADLNSIGASTMVVGGFRYPTEFLTGAGSVTLRDGAVLAGSEVFLIGHNAITLESGSGINTIGRGAPAFDADDGDFRFWAGAFETPAAGIGVSNGRLVFGDVKEGVGSITIEKGASLLSEGTIGFLAPGQLSLDSDARLGTRSLILSLPTINIGDADTLSAAGAAGILPDGWQLDQARLLSLALGDQQAGIPGLESLVLTTSRSVNLFGSFDLDATQADLSLIFNSPALYGWGNGEDTATLRADRFVWNGVRRTTGSGQDLAYSSQPAGPVTEGGPGTGAGQLEIFAREIVFGYPENVSTQNETTLDRLALGFAGVTLTASEKITSNSRGSLSAFESGTDASSYSGGNLTLIAPLLTGEPASVMSYRAGGALIARAPDGAEPVDTSAVTSLGGEIRLKGETIALDTAVALPSGRLLLTANGDIDLGGAADIDLAGRAIRFFDQERHSWGGDLLLESAGGSIRQAAGSTIDVSASGNQAGLVQATATGNGSTVNFQGALLGQGGEGFDSGAFDVRATVLSDFAGLNAMLNAGEFFGARGFVVKTGDLVVGDEVRAGKVSISVDGGSLTIDGRIDASGDHVGTIRLAARDDLILTSNSVIDAHGNLLRTDRYGAPIDSSNTAQIVLTSTEGAITLMSGATLDLRAADAIARGQLEINAPRLGASDVAINAAGPLDIRGASSIAVNAFRSYTPDDGVIDQGYLDGIHADSTAFVNAALENTALAGRLAGLTGQDAQFHFRPGVEIRSDTDLSTKFDLDLSGYRYGPNANPAVRGSGEAGVMVIRTAGDLGINGSINDGFAPPPVTPDDNGWTTDFTYLQPGVPASEDVTFMLPFNPTYNDYYYVLPGIDTNEFPTVVSGQITDWYGTYGPGDQIPGFYYGEVTIAAGTVLSAANPADATLAVSLPREQPGQLWAVSPMLAAGSQSWSLRLVAGGDLSSADSRTLRARGQLGEAGNLVLRDKHVDTSGEVELPSVVRTGTGQLDLLAGGNFEMASLFGIYTAGTQIDGVSDAFRPTPAALPSGYETYADIPTQSYFTERGGALSLVAQGDVRGRTISTDTFNQAAPTSSEISYWLWRQGDELGRPAAWSVNFGSYREIRASTIYPQTPVLAAFSGIGTFGGGDLNIVAGGDAGVRPNEIEGINNSITAGLNLVVGGSGRVIDGELVQTGGGDLSLRVGGDLNPTERGDQFLTNGAVTNLRGNIDIRAGAIGRTIELYGASPPAIDPRPSDSLRAYGADGFGGLTIAIGDGSANLQSRGDLVLAGSVDPGRARFGQMFTGKVPSYTLAAGDPAPWPIVLAEDYVVRAGEPLLEPFFWEGTYRYAGDPAPTDVTYPAGKGWYTGQRFLRPVQVASVDGDTRSWFTLWTDRSAIELFSAGGNLIPLATRSNGSDITARLKLFPGTLRAVAANGSIYATDFRNVSATGDNGSIIELAPSPLGQLELLAGDSIVATGNTFAQSGADPSLLPTPFRPAYSLVGNHPNTPWALATLDSNVGAKDETSAVVFGLDTASGSLHLGDDDPSRFYAVNGDIVGLRAGLIYNPGFGGTTQYIAAEPVHIRAGRDILSLGNINLPSIYNTDRFNGSFFLHDEATDISLVTAGRDIFYADAFVAGPGTLEVRAGRNLFQGARGILNSVGAVNTSGSLDISGGADIAVLVGAGAAGPAYSDFARLYFDPANRADPERPLADQEGKVVATYDRNLAQWLAERFSYEGDDPLGYFVSLPEEQQGVFVRKIYYDELRAGGREYNDPDSRRFQSYLRGRQAISALFPATDADGQPLTYAGDLTMFSGFTLDFSARPVKLDSTIRTDFGGDIQIFTPGGQTIIGVEGLVPGSSAGLLTQGSGDIEIYSQKSILLGLTRVFTTFGGDIVMWSAEGDINAGRGARGTVVYAPVRRVYDEFGNVVLSPTAPTSGAGIGTLNPMPEVEPGDIDLIAPLGTIDAGEAGIRVSGDINLAALQVLNAANIDVQGEATGIPQAAAVNTGALTAASSATGAVINEAAQLAERARPQVRTEVPAIVYVRFVGFGE